jgi:uncharacterized protein YebE (UPF0316 family)
MIAKKGGDVDTGILISAGAIFVLRVVGNMLTTVRLVLIVRGQKLSSSLISILETLIFAIAFGKVVSNLDDVWNLAGYSVGFAVGGYLGLTLEQRLIQRFVAVHIISPTLAHEIAVAVREAGYGATETWGQGAQGQVGSVIAVVGHQQVRDVVRVVHGVDPKAFVTLEELRGISHGYFQRLVRPER